MSRTPPPILDQLDRAELANRLVRAGHSAKEIAVGLGLGIARTYILLARQGVAAHLLTRAEWAQIQRDRKLSEGVT